VIARKARAGALRHVIFDLAPREALDGLSLGDLARLVPRFDFAQGMDEGFKARLERAAQHAVEGRENPQAALDVDATGTVARTLAEALLAANAIPGEAWIEEASRLTETIRSEEVCSRLAERTREIIHALPSLSAGNVASIRALAARAAPGASRALLLDLLAPLLREAGRDPAFVALVGSLLSTLEDTASAARAADALGDHLAAGRLDVSVLAPLGAPLLERAIARVKPPYPLKIQVGLERIAITAAAQGDGARPTLLVCLHTLSGLGDPELGARVAKRIREAAKVTAREVAQALEVLEGGR
jgi:hypothetical protein